jgi:outer membrane protein assembly factor BamB
MRSIIEAVFLCLLGGLICLVPRNSGLAADWPQWRGPNRDGVVKGLKVPDKWPRTLKEEWKVEVGEGYSSPVVADGKVYVFTRQKDDEILSCLDVATGKENWRSEPYPAPYKPGPGAPGDVKTRSTPTVAGGRIFTLGVGGIFSAWDTKTGKLLWRKDPKQYPIYGASMSPLVDGEVCIVHLGTSGKGGLTAFDMKTGDEKWSHTDVVAPAYASPIIAELAGERQVVTATQGNFIGVSAATGKKLWGIHCPRFDLEQCITPVLYKDLIIFAQCGEPLRAIRLEKGEKGITPKEIWKADGHPFHMSSPVLAGDYLVGFCGQNGGYLFCLDAKTGETLWWSKGQRMGGYATILNAGSAWLVLTDTGKLIVLKPSGEKYEPIAEYKLSETGGAWGYPIFLGERIIIKDQTTLRAFKIEPDSGK